MIYSNVNLDRVRECISHMVFEIRRCRKLLDSQIGYYHELMDQLVWNIQALTVLRQIRRIMRREGVVEWNEDLNIRYGGMTDTVEKVERMMER